MAKKSLFERMGLVQSIEEETEVTENVLCENVPEEELEVDVESVTQNNLIEDIYSCNSLSDYSRSIFKVEQLINSLPKEMPNETKKTTVLTILSSFNLTIEEIMQDAVNRQNIISAAYDEIVGENESVINNNDLEIEEKKMEIQNLEKDTASRKSVIHDTSEKINKELTRIKTLVDFVGGGQ